MAAAQSVNYGACSNGYTTLAMLGQGSSGEVILAEDNQTRIQYAIKKSNKRAHMYYNTMHHLVRERRAMERLDHRNIIKLRGFMEDKEDVSFVMDYMRHNMMDYFLKFGKFDLPCIKFYAAELITALEYMRSQNYVHRDIKTENLMLDVNMHLKLMDFDASKKIGEPQGNPRRAKAVSNNSYVGSRPLMPPEVINMQPVTFSTDLWCLGCLIYEWYTGEFAFDPTPQCQLEDRINNVGYDIPRGADPDWADLVIRLLVFDPAQRLGAAGFAELKQHAFFHGVDWANLHRTAPPALRAPPVTRPRPPVPVVDWTNGTSPPGSPTPEDEARATPPPIAPPLPKRKRN